MEEKKNANGEGGMHERKVGKERRIIKQKMKGQKETEETRKREEQKRKKGNMDGRKESGKEGIRVQPWKDRMN